MSSLGCDACRRWLQEMGNGEMERVSDCRSSFKEVNSYFTANLIRCPRCGVTWLEGYHEDFSGRPVEDEWGERVWIYRPLTPAQVAEIEAARDARSLDISTFAKPV